MTSTIVSIVLLFEPRLGRCQCSGCIISSLRGYHIGLIPTTSASPSLAVRLPIDFSRAHPIFPPTHPHTHLSTFIILPAHLATSDQIGIYLNNDDSQAALRALIIGHASPRLVLFLFELDADLSCRLPRLTLFQLQVAHLRLCLASPLPHHFGLGILTVCCSSRNAKFLFFFLWIHDVF
ncbi:hypothetical protein H4582DRAFT_497499 [Lactarius indigo]|nr:hypothetical protein H4582DRAFT_497499 [Lactarius indigo]